MAQTPLNAWNRPDATESDCQATVEQLIDEPHPRQTAECSHDREFCNSLLR